MQLGFERREVWTLLYSFLPPPYTSHKLHDVNFKLAFKPKNSFSWPSHKEKNPTQCSAAKFITRPLLPIEYLGQKKLKIYTPTPTIKPRKIARSGFWFLRSFILDFFVGGGGAVGLLFHFILSKIVVKITVGWVVRGKICIGQ